MVPRKRYFYYPPSWTIDAAGARRKSQGQWTSPFPSFWYGNFDIILGSSLHFSCCSQLSTAPHLRATCSMLFLSVHHGHWTLTGACNPSVPDSLPQVLPRRDPSPNRRNPPALHAVATRWHHVLRVMARKYILTHHRPSWLLPGSLPLAHTSCDVLH